MNDAFTTFIEVKARRAYQQKSCRSPDEEREKDTMKVDKGTNTANALPVGVMEKCGRNATRAPVLRIGANDDYFLSPPSLPSPHRCHSSFRYLVLSFILLAYHIPRCLGLNMNEIKTTAIRNVPLRREFLRRNDDRSPFCYVVSSALTVEPKVNFLATQVWPSSRIAAGFVEKYLQDVLPDISSVCELGCGPGLPSLTIAARLPNLNVLATDLDEFALELVNTAAKEQSLDNLTTIKVDLCGDEALPEADLYILSDVFETSAVAHGAALLFSKLRSKRVWVFCQSDRANRDIFAKDLGLKDWVPTDLFNPETGKGAGIKLFDVDESRVSYS